MITLKIVFTFKKLDGEKSPAAPQRNRTFSMSFDVKANVQQNSKQSELKSDDVNEVEDEGPNYLNKIDEKSRKRSKSELDKLLSNNAEPKLPPNLSSNKSITELDEILFGNKSSMMDSMQESPPNAPKKRSLTDAARDNPDALTINHRTMTDDPFAEFKSKVEPKEDFLDELFGKKQLKSQTNFGGNNIVENGLEVESKKMIGPRGNKSAMPWEESMKPEKRTIPNGDVFMMPGMVGE